MGRSNKRKTKPKVSSKGKTKRCKLGWGQTSRNANTLKKLEKINQEEREDLKNSEEINN